MTKNTPRDRVWIYVLYQAFEVGAEAVRSQQVADATGVSERTARDTLKTMPFTEEYRIPDGRVRYDIDITFFTRD